MKYKQNKVVNKINRDTGKDRGGHIQKNNDECYTSMKDILDELGHWAELGKFKGKRIICPCDWDVLEDHPDVYGITITYDDGKEEITDSVHKFDGVRVTDRIVQGSLFSVEEGMGNKITIEEVNREFFDEKDAKGKKKNDTKCNFLRTFMEHAVEWGIKSITVSGYNPATNKGIKFQEIDYSQYDICVTNPPFSLYREFMKTIVGRIDFIVLAPFLNRISPNVGLNLMLKKAYLGYGVNLGLNFNNKTSDNNFVSKKVNCDWITSFPEAQEERNNRHFKSGVEYELYKDEFEELPNMTMRDGTHPIWVKDHSVFPEDYDGWMFVSAGMLNDLDQDAYEWYGTNFKGYYNTDNPDANPFAHKTTNQMVSDKNGKQMFHGIVFRKRK